MKRKIYILAISLYISIAGNCQFTPVNINYPDPTYYYWPDYVSIVDASTVWLGTFRYAATGSALPFPWAVKTTDGGNTWILDSIPVSGQPIISSVCALDANTCFYTFTNNWSYGSIWKTSDGGTSWTKKTTTQFLSVGAVVDFFYAFDANEGVAVGDPTLGYFEIQRTTDGGDTWSKVPSSSIPSINPPEYGFIDSYTAVGDNIWFPSYKPYGSSGNFSIRCFKSIDRGQNWTVSPNIANDLGDAILAFSTSQKGVLLDNYYPTATKNFYRTSDGGNTWTKDSLSVHGYPVMGVSRVDGFDGGFMMALFDTAGISETLLFTPDFFSTTIIIDSNLAADPYGLWFKDATTGWNCGIGADTSEILKYNGILTSISSAGKSPEKLSIIPNPTSSEAIVKLPGKNEQGDLSLMIYDVAGTLLEKRPVESATGWTKINASSYNNGVYILKVVSGDRLIASAKWVVQH